MTQNELNHAVAAATRESVGTINSLGFGLLTLPPTYPLAIPAYRRNHPLRIGPEARKRKRKPPRRQAKTSSAIRS